MTSTLFRLFELSSVTDLSSFESKFDRKTVLVEGIKFSKTSNFIFIRSYKSFLSVFHRRKCNTVLMHLQCSVTLSCNIQNLHLLRLVKVLAYSLRVNLCGWNILECKAWRKSNRNPSTILWTFQLLFGHLMILGFFFPTFRTYVVNFLSFWAFQSDQTFWPFQTFWTF